MIGFSPEEVGSVHRILAAILHLVSLAARAGGPPPHMVSWLGATPGGGDWPLTTQLGSWPTPPSAEAKLLWLWALSRPGPGLWALRAQIVASQACDVPSP